MATVTRYLYRLNLPMKDRFYEERNENMRFIDADKMKIGISEKTKTGSEASRFIDIIDSQPTAFDLESAIERLCELKTYKLNIADAMSEIMSRGNLGNYICLEDVIEILKSAANATNGKNGGREV